MSKFIFFPEMKIDHLHQEVSKDEEQCAGFYMDTIKKPNLIKISNNRIDPI